MDTAKTGERALHVCVTHAMPGASTWHWACVGMLSTYVTAGWIHYINTVGICGAKLFCITNAEHAKLSDTSHHTCAVNPPCSSSSAWTKIVTYSAQ